MQVSNIFLKIKKKKNNDSCRQAHSVFSLLLHKTHTEAYSISTNCGWLFLVELLGLLLLTVQHSEGLGFNVVLVKGLAQPISPVENTFLLEQKGGRKQ